MPGQMVERYYPCDRRIVVAIGLIRLPLWRLRTHMSGPNYIKRLRIQTEEDRLELRTAVSVPGCLWAGLLSAFASLPISIYPVSIGLIREYPSGPFALWMAVAIFGTTIAGTL